MIFDVLNWIVILLHTIPLGLNISTAIHLWRLSHITNTVGQERYMFQDDQLRFVSGMFIGIMFLSIFHSLIHVYLYSTWYISGLWAAVDKTVLVGWLFHDYIVGLITFILALSCHTFFRLKIIRNRRENDYGFINYDKEH